MTPQQIGTVQATWRLVAEISDTASDLFYERLFELDPDLRPLFDAVDMSAQKTKLVEALSLTVAGLDDPEALTAPLAELGKRHAGYGVTDSHYDTVGAALIWTLERGLGPDWSEHACEAWASAYRMIAGEMMRGAASAH